VLEWLQRRRNIRQRLSVCPTPGGVSLALADRDENDALVIRWAEHLTLEPETGDSAPGSAAAATETAATPDQRAEQRSSDRRGSDRRATDRRQGDRRQMERRDGAGAQATSSASQATADPRLVDLLQRFVRERNLKNIPCTGLLRAGDYSLVLVDSPDVPPSEIRSAMRWQIRELIDFHIDDAVIDVFDLPERDGHSARRMYAVAARRERVLQLISLTNLSGLNLQSIDIPELALRNIAARLPEDAGGVALIALDRQQGLMTVTRQDALYFSRRVDCNTERLLAASEGEDLTPALESLLDGLTIEIQRSLDFYERHFSQSSVAGIVISPVPGLSDKVCAYLQAQLGIPTRWLDVAAQCVAPVPEAVLVEGISVLGGALREEQVAL